MNAIMKNIVNGMNLSIPTDMFSDIQRIHNSIPSYWEDKTDYAENKAYNNFVVKEKLFFGVGVVIVAVHMGVEAIVALGFFFIGDSLKKHTFSFPLHFRSNPPFNPPRSKIPLNFVVQVDMILFIIVKWFVDNQ